MSKSAITPMAERLGNRCAWTAGERAEWLRLLQESGKGIPEFCRKNDLAESTVSSIENDTTGRGLSHVQRA
jgi:hypothetical protein